MTAAQEAGAFLGVLALVVLICFIGAAWQHRRAMRKLERLRSEMFARKVLAPFPEQPKR
jgi:hypothetical protein